jgi:hypothetical protein
MKTTRSFPYGLVFVGLLVLAALWFVRKPAKAPQPVPADTNATLPSAQRAVAEPRRINRNPTSRSNSAASASRSSPSEQGTVQRKMEGLATLNDVPILFYGKLEDQFANPVVGARVATSIRIYNGARSAVERSSVVSSANGLFQISGGMGESLGVVPSKQGYVLAATNTYFKYSYLYPDHFTPDPNSPTVIKMFKLQGAEPLVGIDQRFRIPVTGTPTYFDLLAGKIVPNGGDLSVTVERPAGVVSQQQPQDWGLKIEAVDGGLIETSFVEARVTFQAPENGYQPSDTIHMSTTNHWSNLDEQMFFLSSRKGQVYSKVYLSFLINPNPQDPAAISFRGAANANASRNWEATIPQ